MNTNLIQIVLNAIYGNNNIPRISCWASVTSFWLCFATFGWVAIFTRCFELETHAHVL